MTGPASFTPQPYPLRAIERYEGAINRIGMVIGWTSDGPGIWTPVVAFDGSPAAVEGLPMEGAIWEYQVPEPAPRPRMPYESAAEPTTTGGETTGLQPSDVLPPRTPPKRKETGRQSVLGSPLPGQLSKRKGK